MINRRALLTGLATSLAMPAVVRASSLMPVMPLRLPLADWLPLDGRIIRAQDYPELYRLLKANIYCNTAYRTLRLPDYQQLHAPVPGNAVRVQSMVNARSDDVGCPIGTIQMWIA